MDRRCVEDFTEMAKLYGGIRLIAFEAEPLEKAYKIAKPVVVYRFMLYEHYLRTVGAGRYRHCLHADLFDTFFQRDPFKAVAGARDGLVLFAENPSITLGSCRYHRYWFNQCNMRQLLHRAHGLPRICMGVVLGAVTAL